MVADQLVQLDHMTEGRVMLGVGPGALSSDAYMMGIDPVTQRIRMNQSLGAIMALLRAEGPVSMETDWFTLREARLQLANYSAPHLAVAVAATFTPTGPTAAGKHGIGLLSVAGADNEGFERTWGWVEEAAAESGRPVDRGGWRVVVPFHLADSKEEALNDVQEGYERRAYFGDRHNAALNLGSPLLGLPVGPIEDQIARGSIIVGTPDDAIAAVNVLQERSGGIGGLLGLAHEWASTEKTNRSYELWARYVAPRFQGQLDTIEGNRNWIEGNLAQMFDLAPAFAKAFADTGKEPPRAVKEGLEAMLKAREARTNGHS